MVSAGEWIPSIHPSVFNSRFLQHSRSQAGGLLEWIPAVVGRRQDDTLDKSPVLSQGHIERHTHTHTHTLQSYIRSSFDSYYNKMQILQVCDDQIKQEVERNTAISTQQKRCILYKGKTLATIQIKARVTFDSTNRLKKVAVS